MTAAVRKALDGLIATLAMRAGIKRAEILELAIVGNPIMHHLVLGIDPIAARRRAVRARDGPRGQDHDRASSGCAPIPARASYLLPCIAGHVGADTAGVILAEQPHQAERMTLVVDVGTNAEIVLGDKHRLLAASSPTGPAFEGAQISGGQRAAPGAIERVRIDRETLEPRFRVIGVGRLVGRAGLRGRRRRDRDHRHLRLGDHRGRRGAVPRRRHHRGRRGRRVARRALAAHRRRRPDLRATSCTRASPAARGSSSPRTTCAPSSSPRPRSTPASGC